MKLAYSFDSFEVAAQVAKSISAAGGSETQIKRSGSTFRVIARLAWKDEIKLLSDLSINEPFRSGCRYTKEEVEFIVDKYLCWVLVPDIASTVKRTPEAIWQLLQKEGWRFTVPLTEGGFGEFDCSGLDFHDACLPQSCLDDLIAVGAIGSSHQSTGDIPLSDLDNSEVDSLVDLLLGQGEFHKACELLNATGEHLEAVQLARYTNLSPVFAHSLLVNVEGLPPLYCYYREVLRSHICEKYIKCIPSKVARWARAAESRTKDYSAPDRILPPRISLDVVLGKRDSLPNSLLALASAYDAEGLIRLAGNGNKLAAALLADRKRLQMWKYSWVPLDADVDAESMRDGYWPTESEVRELLVDNLLFDKAYAKKMSHVEWWCCSSQ